MKKLADEAGRTGRPIHAEQVSTSGCPLTLTCTDCSSLCTQSPLVSGLVEACGGRVLTAAGYTCAVLSTAVDRKWVDPHSLIQQLLVWVPSARWEMGRAKTCKNVNGHTCICSHPHVIVSLVCDLLWKEVSIYHDKDGHYPIQ